MRECIVLPSFTWLTFRKHYRNGESTFKPSTIEIRESLLLSRETVFHGYSRCTAHSVATQPDFKREAENYPFHQAGWSLTCAARKKASRK